MALVELVFRRREVAHVHTLRASTLTGAYIQSSRRRLAPLLATSGTDEPGAPPPQVSAASANVALQRLQDAVASELLQRAAGAAAAAALLRAQEQLEAAAVAGGRWLSGSVLRPNIEWLMSAKPGEPPVLAAQTHPSSDAKGWAHVAPYNHQPCGDGGCCLLACSPGCNTCICHHYPKC